MRILFHTMMKNDICLMVSGAKLCNNVANYGTNFLYHTRKQVLAAPVLMSVERK